MSRKVKATLLILVVILASAAVGWYLLFNGQEAGDERTATSTTQQENPFGRFDGSVDFEEVPGSGSGGAGTSSPDREPGTPPPLRQITSQPVAGYVIFPALSTIATDNVQGDAIRYVERSTGHIYETYTNSLRTRRLTNQTIPGVQEAIFSPNGRYVVMRYLADDNESIRTYRASIRQINSTTSESIATLQGDFLPEGIDQIAFSPDNQQIFYLTSNQSGARGFLIDADGSDQALVWQSPIREWLVGWKKTESVTLTTKPADNVAGYSYELNLTSGELTKLTEGESLLVRRTGNNQYLKYQNDDTPVLEMINNGATELIPFAEHPNKCEISGENVVYCAINPRNDRISEVVKGNVVGDFNISLFDPEERRTSVVLRISDENRISQEAYLNNLSITPSAQHLAFFDKTTNLFYVLNLAE